MTDDLQNIEQAAKYCQSIESDFQQPKLHNVVYVSQHTGTEHRGEIEIRCHAHNRSGYGRRKAKNRFGEQSHDQQCSQQNPRLCREIGQECQKITHSGDHDKGAYHNTVLFCPWARFKLCIGIDITQCPIGNRILQKNVSGPKDVCQQRNAGDNSVRQGFYFKESADRKHHTECEQYNAGNGDKMIESSVDAHADVSSERHIKQRCRVMKSGVFNVADPVPGGQYKQDDVDDNTDHSFCEEDVKTAAFDLTCHVQKDKNNK